MGLFSKADANKINAENRRVYGKDNPNNKTYLVNEVVLPSYIQPRESGVEYIGLFSGDSKWDGRGNFCGWYGIEYFLNTTLLAYYAIERSDIYAPKGHVHLKECVLNEHFDELMIGSCYWTKELYAPSDEEAIEKFFKEGFE